MDFSVNELLKLAQEKQFETCIWGAGKVGTQFGLRMLKERGISIDYYCDNNSKLWGKEIVDGIKCISIEELKDRDIICFVMVSIHLLEIVCKQVTEMGIKKIVSYSDLCELEIKEYFPFQTRKQIAIYTCIVGDYDKLRDPIYVSDNCDYFVISDKKPETKVYKYININDFLPEYIEDNTKKNRYCKINAHRIFPQYKYSIYFDGNITLKSDLESKIMDLPKTRIITLSKNFWDCAYIEAMNAIEQYRDYKEVIMRQVEKYWLEGMPLKFGSVFCGVLIREHNNPICKKIMEDWWKEVEQYSKKDQIAFPYVLWKDGYSIEDVGIISENGPYNSEYLILEREHLKQRVTINDMIR